MKKVVFLGTKPIGFDSLDYLISQQESLNYKIIAVGTKERNEFGTEKNISGLSQQYGITLLEENDTIPACDIIYSVQYHKILKASDIEKASEIAINLHLAPLPDYRGCNQFSFAIFNGAKIFGVTIHKIDTGIDSGEILFEDRFPLLPEWWVQDLFEESNKRGLALLKSTWAKIISGDYQLQPQTPMIAARGMNIYYRKDIELLKNIDLNEDGFKIARKIKATYMPGFEPPYTIIDGQKIHFKKGDS